jgi:hypothetical protein
MVYIETVTAAAAAAAPFHCFLPPTSKEEKKKAKQTTYRENIPERRELSHFPNSTSIHKLLRNTTMTTMKHIVISLLVVYVGSLKCFFILNSAPCA